MSDWADLAAEREQEFLADALAEHDRQAGLRAWRDQEAEEAEEAEVCVICEEPIPAARRTALPGVQTCVACQEELEAELKRKGQR